MEMPAAHIRCISMLAGAWVLAGCAMSANQPNPPAQPSSAEADIALFLDSTETAYCIGDKLRSTQPQNFAKPPSRYFVKDADDSHARLLDGTNAIVGMSLDDVISLSQSSDPRALDLVVIGGVHGGFLQLMAEPGIHAVEQLRGKKVAVDTDTGYASALFEILRRAGLDRDEDYSVVYAGATNVRYDKLLDHEYAATLLGAPFTDLASIKGYQSLGSVSKELGGYQGVVLAAKRSWLDGHSDEARNALATLQAAEKWSGEPANHARLISFIKECVPSITNDAEATRVANTLFGPQSDYTPGGRISDANLKVVLDLYNKSRGAAVTQADVQRLIDYSYLPDDQPIAG